MPSFDRIRFVALRVIRQVLRDRRSLALILVVPVAVIVLLGYVLRQSRGDVTVAVVAGPTASIASLPQAPAGLHVRLTSASEAEDLLARSKVDGVLEPGPPPALHLLGENPQTDQLVQSTVGLILQRIAGPAGAPPMLIVSYRYGGPQYDILDYEAPALIGFFAYFFVFLLTAVSFLRERTGGTLERLLVAPLRRMELVSGYTIGFGIFALVQACLLVLAVIGLKVHYAGNLLLVFILVGAVALGAVNLGIFVSTFATTELQAVQFIPIILVPQALLSGLFFAVKSLPAWLQVVSYLLPLTYATDGLRAVMIEGRGLASAPVLLDLVVLVAFAGLFIILGALTIRGEAA